MQYKVFEDLFNLQSGKCANCENKHGEKLNKNSIVILSINKTSRKNVLLCQPCAFQIVRQEIKNPVHGVYSSAQKKQDEVLKTFGLEQEKLL